MSQNKELVRERFLIAAQCTHQYSACSVLYYTTNIISDVGPYWLQTLLPSLLSYDSRHRPYLNHLSHSVSSPCVIGRA
jgi:hypothetical protein